MKLSIFLGVAALSGALVGCSSDNGGGGGGGQDGGAHDASGDSSSGGDASGGDSSSGDSSTADSASEGGGDAGMLSCTSYCTTITANCTGNNKEYTTFDTCRAMCMNMTVGTQGMTSGDTLGCRTYHANAAQADPATHCVHAGPSGADVCGTSHCEAFCTQAVAYCGTTPYATKADCLTACAGFTYNKTTGDLTDTNKNTFNCRLYHLEAAFAGATAKTTHCPHIAAQSTVCTM